MCQIWVQRSHFWRLLVTVDFDDGFNTKVCSVDHIIIISPQSERSELGAFYFCPGVLSGYCCVCESGYCNWIWNTNINSCMGVSGYCFVWERGYCNWVCYRGSSEKWQIWVQWWHFWRLLVTVDFDDNFNTKVWSFHHIIIVIYINDVYYIGGLQKSGKFGCSGDTFGGRWLLLILMIVSTQKYGQLII